MVLIGTIYDIYIEVLASIKKYSYINDDLIDKEKESALNLIEANKKEYKKKNKLTEILISFSVYTNLLKIFRISIEENTDDLKCLHGIRVLCCFW